MSDVEGDDVPVAVASGPMDINTAIAEVLDYYLYIQMLSLTQFSHCLTLTLYLSHTNSNLTSHTYKINDIKNKRYNQFAIRLGVTITLI